MSEDITELLVKEVVCLRTENIKILGILKRLVSEVEGICYESNKGMTTVFDEAYEILKDKGF